jgi:hypothetical protein
MKILKTMICATLLVAGLWLREFPHRDDVEGRMDQVFKSRRPLVCRDFLDKSEKK